MRFESLDDLNVLQLRLSDLRERIEAFESDEHEQAQIVTQFDETRSFIYRVTYESDVSVRERETLRFFERYTLIVFRLFVYALHHDEKTDDLVARSLSFERNRKWEALAVLHAASQYAAHVRDDLLTLQLARTFKRLNLVKLHSITLHALAVRAIARNSRALWEASNMILSAYDEEEHAHA